MINDLNCNEQGPVGSVTQYVNATRKRGERDRGERERGVCMCGIQREKGGG